PRSARRALRPGCRALMRTRPREVAILRPVAERSRHPAQITIVREWFQHHRGEFSKRSNRPRAPPRPLYRTRPSDWMLARALFPAQMEQDSRDVDLDGTDILARAAQR